MDLKMDLEITLNKNAAILLIVNLVN